MARHLRAGVRPRTRADSALERSRLVASDVEGLRRSAFIRSRGARALVVETAPDARRDAVLAALRERLGWARLADVIVVPRIPVDARHNAKVDYPALERMIG